MTTSKELKEKRVALHEEMMQLHNKAKEEKRMFTAEEKKNFDNIKSQIDELLPQIEEMEERERLETIEAGKIIESRKKEKKEITKKPYSIEYRNNKGEILGGYLHGDDFFADLSEEQRKINIEAVKHFLAFKEWPAFATDIDKRSSFKTNNTGLVVNEAVDAHIRQDLAEIFHKMGFKIPIISLKASTLSIMKLTNTPTVNIKAEGAAFSEDDSAKFGNIVLDPHNAGVLASFSKELDQDSVGFIAAYWNTIMKAFADHFIEKFLNGTGTGEPEGIINKTGVQEVANVGELTSYNPFINAWVKALQANSIPSHYLLNPREAGVLEMLTTSGSGAYMEPPTSIRELKRCITNMIPTDLGTGSNESYAILLNPTNCILGIRQGITFSKTDLYRYAEDEITIKATCRYDINTLYPQEIIKLTNITPGA